MLYNALRRRRMLQKTIVQQVQRASVSLLAESPSLERLQVFSEDEVSRSQESCIFGTRTTLKFKPQAGRILIHSQSEKESAKELPRICFY